MKDNTTVEITGEGQEALDGDGPNGGIVKIHGLDDTRRIDAEIAEMATRIGHKIIPIQVIMGSYAGVIYVIDPD